MNVADLRRIEEQADVSFERGQIIGNKVKKATKKTFIVLFVLIGSIIATILFFIYGFIDHKYKHKL